MTRSVNSLIRRATANGAPAGTIPSGHVRAFIDALERIGIDRASLMATTGIDAATLMDPDALVPTAAMVNVICFAQERRIPNVGLKIACEVPIGAFPLLDYLVVTSERVSDGMDALARYLSIAGSPAVVTIHDTEDPVRVVIEGNPFTVEYTASLVVRHLQHETDGRFHAELVSFQHVPDDRVEFEARLGAPLSVGAQWSGFAVSRTAWHLPFRRRDPVLRELLRRQADEARGTTPERDDVVGEVRNALMARLGGDLSIRRIAADLNTTGRTLQRRLASAGSSYEAVRDRVLCDGASRLLTSRAISISEIAYLLGYSEPAAFHRAFKRWTGSTPQAFRKRAASA